MTKYLIFDSGPLIDLTTNGLLDAFRELSEKFQGEFIITDSVKYETIEHPLNITRFEWGAIRIRELLEDGTIKLIEDEELVTQEELKKKTQEVMNAGNNSFIVNGKPIHLIERGESESIALSILLSEEGIDNAIVIDERTARMLCENPDNLKKLMEEKLRIELKLDKNLLKMFNKVKIIRSTELAYLAFKKNIVDGDKKKLEAMLYALKFGGCSISEKEVSTIRDM